MVVRNTVVNVPLSVFLEIIRTAKGKCWRSKKARRQAHSSTGHGYGPKSSRQDVVDDPAVHVGEAEVAASVAERQPFVIKAE